MKKKYDIRIRTFIRANIAISNNRVEDFYSVNLSTACRSSNAIGE